MASDGSDWDAQKILDLYIYDYMKRKMPEVAEIFAKEAKVCENPISEGFLTEWWAIFWDVYSSRMKAANAAPGAESSVKANVMESMQQKMQPAIPTSRPNVNDQWTQVPAGTNIGSMMMGPHSELALLMAAKQQYEEDQRRNVPPPTNLNANMQLFDANQWAVAQQAQASSSSASPQLLQQAFRMPQPQQHDPRLAMMQAPRVVQQQGARDNRRGINLGRSVVPDAAQHGASLEEVLQTGVLTDAGKNKGVMPSPMHRRPVNASGTAPYEVGRHVLNSFVVPPQQNAAYHQSDFSNASAQMLEKPLQGGTNCVQDLMLPTVDSSLLDGQVSEVQMEVLTTQTAEIQMTDPPTQGETLPKKTQSRKQLKKKEKRKKRSSSTALSSENSLGPDNIEVDKPENEDVDSFLSQCDFDADDKSNSFSPIQLDTSVINTTENKAFSFQEVSNFQLSKAKVLCCHFSSDGKYLASAGHEKKVLICNMDSFNYVIAAEGHSNIITDVRFRPLSTIFATSSFDKTVCLWNAAKTNQSLLTLHGHEEQVMSIDFHPRKQDLICSCDSNNEIRLWDVNQNACAFILKGASRQVRFQPPHGNLLAAASGNAVSLIGTDTNMPQFILEGHTNEVRSICWDASGMYLASVSEDRARIWSTASGGKCMYELHSNGNKFESCTFHPRYSQLLVLGSYQTIELWNPAESNKTKAVQAHDGIIASLADSPIQELVASASHDQCVKVWR